MTQKIVMKVVMTCDKCRTKAMKIAAVTTGVISVAIEGGERNMVVVIGDGVDTAKLARKLGKKVGHTSLELVEAVKPKAAEKKEEKTEEKLTPIQWASSNYIHYPSYPLYGVVCCEPTPRICSIM